MSATISDDGLYRYNLTRQFTQLFDDRKLVFCMLNPSTADATKDDPTLRRCIGFANRLGYTSLEVVNLYAYRATDPKALWKVDDPVGPDNDRFLKEAFSGTDLVICAWGSNAKPDRIAQVKEILNCSGVAVKCVHRNSDGTPMHPLYAPGDRELVDYELP